jgi:hypothetical protein
MESVTLLLEMAILYPPLVSLGKAMVAHISNSTS